MPLYPFEPNDIFYNRVETHPKVEFFIYDTKVYYNNNGNDIGQHSEQANHIPTGHISLYEMNVDRDEAASGQLIHPFVTKESGITAFKTVGTSDFNSGFLYGEEIEGTYPLSSSLAFYLYRSEIAPDISGGTVTRPHLLALKNTLDHYKFLSDHYAYSSSLGNKGTDDVRLISIPSIFYGSSIKKGSVSLRFYITGTLVGELQDVYKNGELIQVSGSANDLSADYGSGSVAGVVLYNEGFVILTGSWSLDPSHVGYYTASSNGVPQWLGFGQSVGKNQLNSNLSLPNASWGITFNGVNYVPTLTMMANAPKGMYNHSNNPTYKKNNQNYHHPVTSSKMYREYGEYKIKNTVSSSWSVLTSSNIPSYSTNSASFKKQTYISKIGIYDEQKNLIAIAKLAKPVKKTEQDAYTFKLKLDF
jgi:hypothetical protein